DEELDVNIRLVDCVGYAVSGAKGFEDEHGPRMIHTPWYEEAIPFHDAAESGTRKVIQEHSTIGVVITTDGSIGEIGRENYSEAAQPAAEHLKELRRRFIMLLTAVHRPEKATENLRQRLAEQHDVPVLSMNVEYLDAHDVINVLREPLFEFPVLEVNVNLS